MTSVPAISTSCVWLAAAALLLLAAASLTHVACSKQVDPVATIGDVYALGSRYQKSLSARLCPVPGKREGEIVNFDNPILTRSKVMAIS